MPEVRLTGCSSRPLLGYLKALGVLRIVAMQIDAGARGKWNSGAFELNSQLTVERLHTFFRDEYAPSPVLSPWNGRSGFYPKGNATAVKNIECIEHSDDPRLAAYRKLITATRAILSDLGLSGKPEEREAKERLLRSLRRRWPDDALEWLDAAVVLGGESVRFPPLLGSGGNDGSYDFSSNFMEAIGDVLLDSTEKSSALLFAALEGTPARLAGIGLAHLFRDSSVTNSPTGESSSIGNPWDLVLGIEGTLLLAAGTARRHGSLLPGSLVSPFTVNATAAGYGSAVDGESGRAELWLPLWNRWTTLSELSTLVREARAQVGGAKRRQASTGLDFARAAGELGVARGIKAFERYAILERAGQSSLAVPVGRIAVEERPAARALRGIDSWLTAVSRYRTREECPRVPKAAISRLERAAFEMASKGTPESVCATIEAIGAVEGALTRTSSAADAVHPLRGAPANVWVDAANDGTPELAVAVGLASLRDPKRRKGTGGGGQSGLPAMRDYLHGTITDPDGNVAFDPDRSRAVDGNGLIPLLAALHSRRNLDATRAGGVEVISRPEPKGDRQDAKEVRGQAQFDFPVASRTPLEAVRLLAAGALDERRVLTLLRGLVVLDYDREPREGRRPADVPAPPATVAAPTPEPILELLALAWQPPLTDKGGDPRAKRALGGAKSDANQLDIGTRPGWATSLAAGAVRPVVEDALLRLRMAGLPPIPRANDFYLPATDRELGRRLAAALLLHIRSKDMGDLVKAYIEIDKQEDEKETR